MVINKNQISINAEGKENKFCACIFDFDGVVMDTEKYHYNAWKSAFARHGIELTEEEYAPLKSTGKYVIECVGRRAGCNFTEREKEGIYSTKIEVFSQLIKDISERDIVCGVLDFLALLKENKVKTAVASSARTTTTLIQKFGLRSLFDAVVDGNSGHKKKPSPDIFLAASKQLDVPNGECLVFEDSVAGIEAAVNAGMSVISVGIRDGRALGYISDFTDVLNL